MKPKTENDTPQQEIGILQQATCACTVLFIISTCAILSSAAASLYGESGAAMMLFGVLAQLAGQVWMFIARRIEKSSTNHEAAESADTD